MMRRLTRRRQVKKRSKHSRNNKYKKTRRGKYVKKRRDVTRRRVLRGGVIRPRPRDIDIDLSENNKLDRFKDLVDALQIDPDILNDYSLQTAYKNMIEFNDGYIGLTGLKFINYLWERINLLDKDDNDEYENLQTAVSLMDQNAIALGITCQQLPAIQSRTNPNYYCCYLKLFNELARKLRIAQRHIPLSTSACHIPCSSIVIEGKDVNLEGVDPGCKLKDYKRRRFEG
jgi:hypothetical protein